MIVAAFITGILIVTIILVRERIRGKFKNQVKQLNSAADISELRFNYHLLNDLPAPVAKYFRHVLKEGQPYISTVNLTHDGLFKTGLRKNWININGKQFFTASPPGFIWQGTTGIFTALDMYIHDKGALIVYLLSLFSVVNARGKTYDEAELQRWLAECVWFPTNLLPNENLSWEDIDNNKSRLTLKYKEVSISYVVTFNDAGEITQFETMRFMSEDKRETWIGTLWDYKDLSGVIIPTTIEVKWVIGKEHFPYARFHVNTIQYNVAAL
ncbi:MAG: DUF6544 family protein [Bacteroidota bacterium]